MTKFYTAKKNFWIGEINKGLKSGDKVKYDDEKGLLVINGQKYEVKNLKAAIKAEWLVPEDGDYPELDGPLGETEAEAVERRRKERFAKMADKKKMTVDERVVGGCVRESDPSFAKALNLDASEEVVVSRKIPNVGGCIDASEGSKFAKALDLDIPKSGSKKFKELVADDTVIVKSGDLFDESETLSLKKAMNQDAKEKKDPKDFAIFKDHYDAEAVPVGNYLANQEDLLKNWSKMHWTKKEDVINRADKNFLFELKGVESSPKIKKRIEMKLNVK